MNIRNLLTETMWSFSYKELQHFDKFLRSSYFRKEHFNNSKIYELFKILKLYFFQFPEDIRTTTQHLPIINWDNVSAKLFPASPAYGRQTCPEEAQKSLSKLCSELINYILDFLAVENFIKKKVDFRISLSEEILNRNLSCLFEHNWKVKYIDGIYSEGEVANIYHRYRLIQIANMHKKKCKGLFPDYELEQMLFEKYSYKVIEELKDKTSKDF